MGTRTSTGEIMVWVVLLVVREVRSGVVEGLDPGVEVAFWGKEEDVEERGLEDEADAESAAGCWSAVVVAVDVSAKLTCVAVRAQHHASRRRIQCARPSFHSISCSSAVNRFLFFASFRSLSCRPTLSGPSNLHALPVLPLLVAEFTMAV